MKRWLKILIISFVSLLLIISISASLMIWVVFTPEKITPIIQKQLAGMVTCEAGIEDVELTFFSTFPRFGIKTGTFYLKNQTPGAPSDTLFRSAGFTAIIDFDAFRKRNEVVLKEMTFDDAFMLLYFGKDGINNFDIMVPKDEPDTSAFSFPYALLDVRSFKLQNATFIYADAPMDMLVELKQVSAGADIKLQGDMLRGNLKINSKDFSFYWDSVQYILNEILAVSSPMSFDINNQILALDDARMFLKELAFNVDVNIQNKPGEIFTDIVFKSDKLLVPPVFDLLNLPFGTYLEGMQTTGNVMIDGSFKGIISKTVQPHFKMNLLFSDNTFEYSYLPYKLSEISGKAVVDMDLNDSDQWHITIDDFRASTGLSTIRGKGTIDQLMGDMRFDLTTQLNFDLRDAHPLLPDDMPLAMRGKASGNASLNFLYSEFMANQFNKMKVKGDFRIQNLIAIYDTIQISSQSANANFQWPMHKQKPGVWANIRLNSPHLKVEMGDDVQAKFEQMSLVVESNDIMASGTKALFDCRFSMHHLNAGMDTMHVAMNQVAGMFRYQQENPGKTGPQLNIDVRSADMHASSGNQQFSTANIQLSSVLDYDATVENPLLRWIPVGEVSFNNGLAQLNELPDDIKIPRISFEFDSDEFLIHDSRLIIGKSDLSLSGRVSDFRPYAKKEGILKAELDFRSGLTDLNYFLQLTNGLGEEDGDKTNNGQGADTFSGPYMVPKGVDITLKARVDEALFAEDVLRDIEGKVIIREGLLVLESVLFTASAAKMQLTGMYETPRRNHIFMGLDFHLMDIEIAELLAMIPDVDTIMPMLRSFDGRGEFHLAIETYVDSAYNIKFSTLRGVSSVKGEDLVLLDGETFSEIAKTLRFSKKAENRVDSLSAEFTIFRNEVDIYPFLIVMDRYKAIVSGQHNLDMSFDYHISLVESPLPIQLGVDVKGTLDNLRVRPASPKYPNLYRPARRNELEKKQLEIREMIRNSLLEKVRQ